MVVMFTTAGVTRATKVATSGVPASTGGTANGAGAAPTFPAVDAATPLALAVEPTDGGGTGAGGAARTLAPGRINATPKTAPRNKEPLLRFAIVVAFRTESVCRAEESLKFASQARMPSFTARRAENGDWISNALFRRRFRTGNIYQPFRLSSV
jgi:hypothetical protein